MRLPLPIMCKTQLQARSPARHFLPGFTRFELCLLIIALTALAALQLPALAKSRESGNRAGCMNNLRQVNLALLEYSADNADFFPPRGQRPFWPERLRPYYDDLRLLLCPSDATNAASFGADPALYPADAAPRSYIMNGFSEYPLAFPPTPLPETVIKYPAQTILFGEKSTESGHFWMDYDQFDDDLQLEQARHDRVGNGVRTGGSHYAFADGSVRFLRFGRSVSPVNLWAITDPWRTNGISPQ